METKPEFKAIMDQRKRKHKKMVDESKAVHKAKIAEAKAEAKIIRSKAKMHRLDAMRGRDGVDEWVAKTRIKIRTPEEAEKTLNERLGCPNPKCEGHGENRGNIMNDIPTCMRCWHKLVPKSKFKDYNRKYWRTWNKKKKRRKR